LYSLTATRRYTAMSLSSAFKTFHIERSPEAFMEGRASL
jgi:hypothetical protein